MVSRKDETVNVVNASVTYVSETMLLDGCGLLCEKNIENLLENRRFIK